MPAPSAPPSLTTPPTAPSRNDAPATFISRMNAFLAWIVTFASEMGTMATALYNYATSAYNDAATANTKAGEATAAASTATTAATTATTQAGIATSAASASAGWKATSTSSLALTSGAKTITIDAGKQFTAGTDIKVKRTSAPTTSYAYTTVSTYNSGTGELTFTLSSDLITGSGTYTDWTVELSGGRGAAGRGVPTGGTTGQVLQKASGTDYDAAWADADSGVEIGDTFFSNRTSFAAGIVPADGSSYLASSYPEAAAIFPPVYGAAPTATTATGSYAGGSYVGNSSLSVANGRLFLNGGTLYGYVLIEITSLSPYTTRTINIGASTNIGPVTYAFGKYISADTNYFRYSTTGLSGGWTQGTALSGYSVYAFAYGNGVLLAATSDGMWRTTDGVSWTKVTAWGSNNLPHGVAFASGYFMAFYSGSGSGMRSTDGLTWTATTNPTVAPQGLVWEANGYFVIGDSSTSGRFRYSSDALTWSSVDVGGTTGDSQAIIYAGGLYCALKSYSLHIASSITGPWTELSNTDANVMNRLVYGLGAFVAPQRYDYYGVRYAPYALASPAQFTVPSIADQGAATVKAKAYTRIA